MSRKKKSSIEDEMPPLENTEEPGADGEEEELPYIETRHYDKYLQCFLTEEQKKEAAGLLVQRMEEKARAEAELGRINKQFKGQIARLDAEITVKAGLVRDGYEFHDVACREVRDYERETLVITRLDTAEEIENRRLNPSEMQRTFPGMA